MGVCARSVRHWIDYWCYTYDPRENEAATIPFDLWPRQGEFLDWLGERERLQEDGLAEKSRDTGLTWLCCAYALHGWLFRKGFACGFGSRKLEYVDDKGNPKSIFEKFRILLAGLPGWMMPEGFVAKKHDCQARLVNPANGSILTGEGGDSIGRGDRTSLFVVDEAAFIERPQLVDRSLSQTTRVRIDVSTPNGPGNPFAEKRFSGRVPVFTLSWREDPRKDQAWYEDQKRRHDPVTVAQEIDIDYSASLEGMCIPAAWVRAAVGLDLKPSGQVIAGLDVAAFGKDRCVYLDRQGPVVRGMTDWGKCNTTETAHRAADLAEKRGAKILCYDVVSMGEGPRGTFESSGRILNFEARAINVGTSPSDTWWPDGKTSKEKFINLRAELWHKLRGRFERAFEFVTQKVAHAPEEMISIPNHPQLIAELSLPLVRHTDRGKIKLESKEDMQKRGVNSPNFADALALAFAVDDGEFTFASARDGIIANLPRDVIGNSGGGQGERRRYHDDPDEEEGDGGDGGLGFSVPWR